MSISSSSTALATGLRLLHLSSPYFITSSLYSPYHQNADIKSLTLMDYVFSFPRTFKFLLRLKHPEADPPWQRPFLAAIFSFLSSLLTRHIFSISGFVEILLQLYPSQQSLFVSQLSLECLHIFVVGIAFVGGSIG